MFDRDVWSLPAPMFHLTLYIVAIHSDVRGEVRGEDNTDRVFPSWAIGAFACVVAGLCQRMPEQQASALRMSVMQGWDSAHVAIFDRAYKECMSKGAGTSYAMM